jgi:biotin carboxyl carrier protein
MKWLVKTNNKSHKVSVPRTLISNVPFEVSVDGNPLLVKWQEATKTLYVLESTDNGTYLEKPISLRNIALSQFPGDNEKSISIEIAGAHAENLAAKVSRYVPGQENRDKAKGDKGALARSPITGKVLKVFVEEGQEVESGTVLLTIEAMKMENKIFATATGKVAKVSVKDGDMVSVGAELIAIK